MSDLPEVKLSYRWITEHEQEIEHRNPFPPGRSKFGFEKGPVKGPLLQIGYYYEKDGEKFGAGIIIAPTDATFSMKAGTLPDEGKKPLVEPGCGVDGDGEIGFNTLTGNYGIIPSAPLLRPLPRK
jgi:hypothetical protein